MSGYDVAPSLSYLKRWAPEDWYLAFLAPVHIISHNDYEIISKGIDDSLSPKQKNTQITKKSRRTKKKK